jgi:hypothetical protein
MDVVWPPLQQGFRSEASFTALARLKEQIEKDQPPDPRLLYIIHDEIIIHLPEDPCSTTSTSTATPSS